MYVLLYYKYVLMGRWCGPPPTPPTTLFFGPIFATMLLPAMKCFKISYLYHYTAGLYGVSKMYVVCVACKCMLYASITSIFGEACAASHIFIICPFAVRILHPSISLLLLSHDTIILSLVLCVVLYSLI